jgi:hypothetical protein
VLGGVSVVGRVATGNFAEGAGKAQETNIATRQNDHERNIFSERVLIVGPEFFGFFILASYRHLNFVVTLPYSFNVSIQAIFFPVKKPPFFKGI